MSEVEIAQAGIGRKFQKPTVFEALSVFENLELAQKTDKSVWASLRATLTGEQKDRIDEVLATIRLQDSRRRPAGLLSHGQKQFLEIGMLLMQDPQLLLLDEPVAGMTDAETEFTAELFKGLAGKHSLMVVEHDMGFVGSIADHVTVLHQGHVLAEGLALEAAATEEFNRASSPSAASILRRQPHPPRPVVRGEGRRGHLPARAQRRGQDHPAEMPHGPDPGQGRRGELGGQADHRFQAAPARARRHRLRAPGPRDLPAPDGGGEPAHGPVPLQRPGSQGGARVHLRAVPGAAGDEAPPRRRPLRRPAATAGHRPRPGQPAAPADPRRAHRRHPALGDQGDWRGDPQAGRTWRHGHPAGGAVLRLRRRAGRPVPGDEPWRNHPAGARGTHGGRGRARSGDDLTAGACTGWPCSRRAGTPSWSWVTPDGTNAPFRCCAATSAPEGAKAPHAEGPEVCQHIIVHPPGGIAGGDRLDISARVGDGAWAQLTSPGAAKWYRARSPAFQTLALRVEAGATLEWLPQETIVFSGAQAELSTRIDLAADARLFYWDVVALGRPPPASASPAATSRPAGYPPRRPRAVARTPAHQRRRRPARLAHRPRRATGVRHPDRHRPARPGAAGTLPRTVLFRARRPDPTARPAGGPLPGRRSPACARLADRPLAPVAPCPARPRSRATANLEYLMDLTPREKTSC
ncbi:hypothetical protein Lal_00004281 [Lupinus albus]|nr:hypothetical protein Lal_00004281 [Lupinus albus]